MQYIQSEYRKIRTRNNSLFEHYSRSDASSLAVFILRGIISLGVEISVKKVKKEKHLAISVNSINAWK